MWDENAATSRGPVKFSRLIQVNALVGRVGWATATRDEPRAINPLFAPVMRAYAYYRWKMQVRCSALGIICETKFIKPEEDGGEGDMIQHHQAYV